MNNFSISGLEIGVILGVALFFALVIFLQIRKRRVGKSCCSVNSSCTTSSSGCGSCNIKTYVKESKKDRS